MEEYINLLEKQFIETKNSNMDFSDWLEFLKIHLEIYYQLLVYMKLNFDNQVVDLEKGKYDNIVSSIPSNKKIIEIGTYAKQIKSRKAISIPGKIVVNRKNSILSPNNIKIDYLLRDEIYLMDLPLNMGNKLTMEALIAFDNQLYVGNYGFNNDANKNAKIKQMRELKKQIELFNKTAIIEEENVTIYDSYLNILKIKPKRY